MTPSAPSRSLTWPLIVSYAIAFASATISAVAAFAVLPSWGADHAPLFLCVVMFVALVAGPGPAVLASVLTFLSLQYPSLSPGYPFLLPSSEIIRLGLFIVASVLVVVLSAAQRRTSSSLQLLRNNQQMMIGELQEQNDILRVENAEHREAATRAQVAEREIRQTVDTVPALIARYRPDGFMDFRNKNWREYTGLSQDNFGGRRWGSALHPDDEEMVEREWREHIATGEPFELEQRLRKADGEYRWHRVRRVPLRGETGEVVKWYAIAFDIDDRKRTEDALRNSEADLAKTRHELQLIIDTIPVLVLRHRADGIIDFVNEVGRTYSGLTTTKWTTRTSIITHPDDIPRLEAAWDVAIVTGESFESEVRLRRADGEYRWFVTRRVPLRRDGEVIAWYAATYDIEDRKQAERELIESERRFREAQMELAHASRVVTMGQFTASIAHEVNQPLAALLTNAETALRWLARQPPDLEKAKTSIERVINDGKRAADIVSRIRDFSRKAPVRKESLEVNKAILEIIGLTRGAMSDNGIFAKMQLAEGLPHVSGDRVHLQQVILNLIMNAIEAMSEVGDGSRELQISTSAAEAGSVLVAVSDSGPRLSPASITRMFEAFYTTKTSGLGIGLSICRSIVDAHGGRLWVKPNEPRGAVFCMMLPIGEANLEPSEA
ncbi:MAG: sensor signal transduction histidine kinase [Tardiphaga sp.]|uniref:PAS domain-containing protein n=1 Tax=Tardiphaga sp. TaxID=1926292 RepID=UPI0026064A52|nr:PAS domain-containing protein [Tardiphaga sp.]MDB5500768.1 sensor signal transduction histidine kinase [Tardiphaga sp.]